MVIINLKYMIRVGNSILIKFYVHNSSIEGEDSPKYLAVVINEFILYCIEDEIKNNDELDKLKNKINYECKEFKNNFKNNLDIELNKKDKINNGIINALNEKKMEWQDKLKNKKDSINLNEIKEKIKEEDQNYRKHLEEYGNLFIGDRKINLEYYLNIENNFKEKILEKLSNKINKSDLNLLLNKKWSYICFIERDYVQFERPEEWELQPINVDGFRPADLDFINEDINNEFKNLNIWTMDNSQIFKLTFTEASLIILSLNPILREQKTEMVQTQELKTKLENFINLNKKKNNNKILQYNIEELINKLIFLIQNYEKLEKTIKKEELGGKGKEEILKEETSYNEIMELMPIQNQIIKQQSTKYLLNISSLIAIIYCLNNQFLELFNEDGLIDIDYLNIYNSNLIEYGIEINKKLGIKRLDKIYYEEINNNLKNNINNDLKKNWNNYCYIDKQKIQFEKPEEWAFHSLRPNIY
ncbi:hypothetical protein Mgra_00002744 [Meloidogyne graminicola]|uniref:Uncharacterized protein n=1 Tax=Meloidogyne graminicola TaxID=189291 RepID=A0A8S9ZVV0_9BILA|nr:hypothetical protein Mgra_00002744 [Meloidogyne graminicola]